MADYLYKSFKNVEASTVDVNSITATNITSTSPISGNIAGNSATATKLANSRNINLTGVVAGTASFDGSADITITTSASQSALVQGEMIEITANATRENIEFINIPSWPKRITISLLNLSLNPAGNNSYYYGFLLRLGTTSGYLTTGYNGSGTLFSPNYSGYNASTNTRSNPTNVGFTHIFATHPQGTTNVEDLGRARISGNIVLTRITGNYWLCTSRLEQNSITNSNYNQSYSMAGSINLGQSGLSTIILLPTVIIGSNSLDVTPNTFGDTLAFDGAITIPTGNTTDVSTSAYATIMYE